MAGRAIAWLQFGSYGLESVGLQTALVEILRLLMLELRTEKVVDTM